MLVGVDVDTLRTLLCCQRATTPAIRHKAGVVWVPISFVRVTGGYVQEDVKAE